MRKIVVREFGGSEVLVAEEAERLAPAPGEIGVRLHAAGVNPADAYIRSGGYAFFSPQLPFTPGFDGAGVVESLGREVTAGVSVGDRVFVTALGYRSTGTYGGQVICEAAAVHPLPGHVSFRQGAALGVPWTTAFRALFQRGRLVAGETVLVHGASGGVGLPAVQLAVRAGATVIGTAGTDAGRDLVREHGAGHVLDHRAPGYLDVLPELTSGRGVDLVVEMLANENLEEDAGLLAQRGRVVVIGSRGSLTFTPRLLMEREADVLGTALWNMTGAEKAEALAGIEEALRDKRVVVPEPGRVYPLSEAARAHDDLFARGAAGKCVLDCE